MTSAPTLLALAISLAAFATLTGCGGGGGSSGDTPATGSQTSTTPTPSASTSPSTPGTGSTTPIPQSTTPNVQPIMVTTAPGLTRNMLTTSVTVCQPGTSNCATIDNIQVDTGSNGLRILASALPQNVSLAAVPSGGGAGSITGECAIFGSGYTWGAVRSADVHMAGQLAAAIPIHVIADAALPNVPADCAGSGLAMQTVSSLRANGILGIGLFANDCGAGCVTAALPRWYYNCGASGSACVATAQALAQQVTNPVSRFALDNNGVVIDLPAIPDTGAVSVSGSLIFGIDTQTNNTLSGAAVIKVNAQTGYVVTTSAGRTYTQSYIDSGSNGLFFSNALLTQCGLWYCPSTTQSANAAITGTDGATNTVSFEIGNSSTLFASANNAFDNLAGVASNAFGWGLPFFFGRRIYTAIDSRVTSVGAGPYYAF